MAKFTLAVVDDEEAVKFIYENQLDDEIDEGLIDLLYFNRAQGILDYLEDRGSEIDILILVSDINMPGMDGVTLTEYIQPRYPNIDIYLSSAYNQSDNQARIDKCQIKGYFQKPVDFDQVKEVIRQKFETRKKSA